MKKIIAFPSIAIAVALSAGQTLAAFSDVPPTQANSEAIEYVKAKGIVQGYADGTFKPGSSINRAELTKIIVGTLLTPEGKDCFPDVHEEWFAPYVCAAKAHEIIGGYPDGSFQPQKNVSFAEAAKIIAVAFGRQIGVATNAWYEPFVRTLADAHAIPTDIDRFDVSLTRGQLAEMIFRLDAKKIDKPSNSYEKMAGLPDKEEQGQSSSFLHAMQGYPYAFSLNGDWKRAWNFYIDTTPVQPKEEEGFNMLRNLDLDRVERMEEKGGKHPEFLRVFFPQGSASPFVTHFYKKPAGGVVARALGGMKPSDSLHLTYYVRFPKDFDFSSEGALPALGGGITSSNYGVWGSDFSVGLAWNERAEVRVSGNFDDQADKDDSRTTGVKFSGDDQWHRIDIVARLNTIPVQRMNGSLTVKFDNQVLYQRSTLRFRSRAEDKWDSLALYGIIGTYDTLSVAARDMHLDLADFSVTEE